MARALQYADWLSRIEKGNIVPAYLFVGPETLLRDQALHELRHKMTGGDENARLEVDRFHGGEASLSQVTTAFSTVGLFSPQRLVILGSVEKFGRAAKKERDELIERIRTAASGSHLVFLSELEMWEFQRKNDFCKKLIGACQVVEFAHPRPAEALRWILSDTKRRGLKLEPEAGELLLDKIGPDLQELSRELEKIALWAEPGEVVRAERLKELIREGHIGNTWALGDALLSGNAVEALRQWDAVRTTENVPRLLWMLQHKTREGLSKGPRGRQATHLRDLAQRLYGLERGIKTGRVPSGRDALAFETLIVASAAKPAGKKGGTAPKSR